MADSDRAGRGSTQVNDKSEQNADGTLRWCSWRVCPNEATSSTVLVGLNEYRACDGHAFEMWKRFS